MGFMLISTGILQDLCVDFYWIPLGFMLDFLFDLGWLSIRFQQDAYSMYTAYLYNFYRISEGFL